MFPSSIRNLLPGKPPAPYPAGYIRGGRGIARRNRKFAKFWSSHIRACKQQQLRLLSTNSAINNHLVILGAGMLLDVEEDLLGGPSITLIDANPACLSRWKNLSGYDETIFGEISEVTGVLTSWGDYLHDSLDGRTWTEAIKLIAEVPHLTNKKSMPLSTFCNISVNPSVVISLNLLSQIPLAWQDTIEYNLKKHFSKTFIKEHEEEWLTAYLVGARLLVEQHLNSLEKINSKELLLITDLEIVNYRGDYRYKKNMVSPPPLTWSEVSSWQENGSYHGNTVTCEVISALAGITENELLTYLPSYSQANRDTWIWHIAPQGLEEQNKGTLHRVTALHLQKT